MHLEERCYQRMFDGCTSLISAPKLPSKTGWNAGIGKYIPGLAEACYEEMFLNCTSLTVAPELPAYDLKHDCYRGMFKNCKSLKVPPELPAIDFIYTYEDGSQSSGETRCYSYMFEGCSSLTEAPVLRIYQLSHYQN